GEPKYLNSSDAPHFRKGELLYGLHWAKQSIRKDERALVVEGYMDVIRCHLAGITHAVAGLGTALTEQQAVLLARYTTDVWLFYDSDEAGQKATFKAGRELLRQRVAVRVASLPDGEDPDSYVAAHGRAGIERAIVQALDLFERQLQLLERKGWFADLAKARRAIDKLMPTIRATADGMTRALYVSRLAAVAGVDAGTIEREAAQPETPRRGTLRTGGGIPDGDAPPWDDAPMGTPPDDHFAAPPAADDGYAPPAPKPPPLDEPKWKGKWRGKAQAPGWRAETAPPAVRRGMLVPGPDLNLVALLLEERAWLAQAEQGVEPRFIADPRLRAIYDTLRELGSQASLDELELALGESAAFAVDAFAGILMQLRLRGVETLAREVQADLDAADPADAQTVAALRAELAELQAERRRLRAARHGKAAPGA
nr:toprim domain-containing protein [Gemmatimonadaceae bacterium]